MLTHLNRHLIGRSANAAGTNFYFWAHILYGLLEDLERIVLGLSANLIQCPIHNSFSDRSFAIPHHVVDELGHQLTVIDRVRQYLALFCNSPSWHTVSSLFVTWLFLLTGCRRALGGLFRPLRSVFGATLLPVSHTYRIERSPH